MPRPAGLSSLPAVRLAVLTRQRTLPLLQWGCIVTESQFQTITEENPADYRRNLKNITPGR
jgi:hypothetical protein